MFSCYYYFKSTAVSHDGGLLSAYDYNADGNADLIIIGKIR